MSRFIYILVLPLFYGLSILPFKILYLVSDFVYLIIYKLIGYRVEVVNKNLTNSFPDKAPKEIKEIEVQFYKYFCDLILESIKTLTISKRSVNKHVRFNNIEDFKFYFDQNQSVIIVLGHQGNWELAGAGFSQQDIHQLFVIYHPLKNKYFDKLVYHMRTRLGNKLYAMKDAIRGVIKDRNEVTATAFIADQTPSPEGAYWTTFLNQDTPVFTGTAKIAKKLKYPIIYASVTRPKRGFYNIDCELLVAKPSEFSEDQISEMHTKRLEKDIIESPHLWLWTHKRWKHSREKNS